jgi:hypothetical protein
MAARSSRPCNPPTSSCSEGGHHADGLRWIGTIFNDAAEHLERGAAEVTPPDPHAIREIDKYMNEMRTRVHVHF